MKHTKLVVVKFVISFAILFVVLGLGYGLALQNILLINLVSILSYFIGDLIILPRTNNIITAIIDSAIAFAVIYLMGDVLTVGGDPLTAAFLTAIAIGVFELFFHRYVANNLELDTETRESTPAKFHQMDLTTEAAHEISPDINKIKSYQNSEEQD